jgi:hypothetical protein
VGGPNGAKYARGNEVDVELERGILMRTAVGLYGLPEATFLALLSGVLSRVQSS